MSIKDAVKLIEESEARFVDLRFTDTKGKQHHFTIPARIVLDVPKNGLKTVKRLTVRPLAVGKVFRLPICSCVPMRLQHSSILSTTIPPLSLPATLSIRPTAKAMTAIRALSHAAPKPI